MPWQVRPRKISSAVPESDLFKALADTLKLWNSQPDWAGDERNVVLTLSRIWYSAATGKIAPKDVAANWVMERLPVQHQPVLLEAQQAYLGQGMDCLASRADQLTAFIYFVKHEAASLLGSTPMMSNSSFKPTPLRGAAILVLGVKENLMAIRIFAILFSTFVFGTFAHAKKACANVLTTEVFQRISSQRHDSCGRRTPNRSCHIGF